MKDILERPRDHMASLQAPQPNIVSRPIDAPQPIDASQPIDAPQAIAEDSTEVPGVIDEHRVATGVVDGNYHPYKFFNDYLCSEDSPDLIPIFFDVPKTEVTVRAEFKKPSGPDPRFRGRQKNVLWNGTAYTLSVFCTKASIHYGSAYKNKNAPKNCFFEYSDGNQYTIY
jgi:hypothetical protein